MQVVANGGEDRTGRASRPPEVPLPMSFPVGWRIYGLPKINVVDVDRIRTCPHYRPILLVHLLDPWCVLASMSPGRIIPAFVPSCQCR